MNNEQPTQSPAPQLTHDLARRLARRPDVAARVQQLLDTLDTSLAEGCTADEAEERVILQLRQFGQQLLQQWACEAHAQVQQHAKRQQPSAVKEGKKNV